MRRDPDTMSDAECDAIEAANAAAIARLDGVGVTVTAPLRPPVLLRPTETPLERPGTPMCAPFRWRDSSTFPRRDLLYGPAYTRRYVTATVAPGGAGKSSLVTAEALAMASGRDLLGVRPARRLRVWYWNGEDDADENDRRVMAAAVHYGLTPADLEGWLFLGSGRQEGGFTLARQGRDGLEVDHEAFAEVLSRLSFFRPDVVILDPLVAVHSVGENDNGAMNAVMRSLGDLAEKGRAAVHVVHHARKAPTSTEREVGVDDARGAVATIAAARHVRVLNPMTDSEAAKAGVEDDERLAYVRVSDGKSNMGPRGSDAWFKMVGVPLGNGEAVGVAAPWRWPSPWEGVTAADLLKVQHAVAKGEWRLHPSAAAWVGQAVAEALGLDLDSTRDKARITTMVETWLKTGALKIVRRRDSVKREEKDFVEVGKWSEA